jgi:[acyl-carrier-protein] S-malonyltransferase
MQNDLQAKIGTTAFAFRGYNLTNIGRTAELLAHAIYGPIVLRHLQDAERVCAEIIGRPADLVKRVEHGDEPGLRYYAESIALTMAVEYAQMELLEKFFDISMSQSQLAFGYSLGELAAVACAGVFDRHDAMRVPLALSADSAALADNVRMGVLFSRGPAIDEADVRRLCRKITAQGRGTIGVSTILSPNSYLLLGQEDTVARFKDTMHEVLPMPAHVRMNPDRWPPMHTEIVRQRNIPDRASVMMERMSGGFASPRPPIVSLVTGRRSYDDWHARDILRQWTDQPQRLWDVVYETLAAGVTTVVHVGAEPDITPATFRRLSDNVEQQAAARRFGKWEMRAAKGIARRPWLSAVLPSRAALMRAPSIRHVILEDWLLDWGRALRK